MVKKSSSEEKPGKQSGPAGEKGKSTPKSSASEASAKKTAGDDKKASPQNSKPEETSPGTKGSPVSKKASLTPASAAPTEQRDAAATTKTQSIPAEKPESAMTATATAKDYPAEIRETVTTASKAEPAAAEAPAGPVSGTAPKTAGAEQKSSAPATASTAIKTKTTPADLPSATSEKTAPVLTAAAASQPPPAPAAKTPLTNKQEAAEGAPIKPTAAAAKAPVDPFSGLGSKTVPVEEKSSAPVAERSLKTSSEEKTKTTTARAYEEPQTPIILAPPAAGEAESIIPPIPEEQHPSISETAPAELAEETHYHPIGPQYQSMFIVQITPELAPLAKVGGLADVVTGLSRELEWRGNNVEIILPKYDCMRYDHIWGLCKTFDDLWVPWYGGHIHCTVWFGFVYGRKCFFIEPHSQDRFFNRGSIYGFDDDIMRFAFFSRAAVEFLLKSGKNPDIIHCHDWQTALVPVYLYEIYQHIGMHHPRVCFTIHNFKHQGVTGDFILRATGLNRPEYYFHRDRLLDNHTPHALNLMKGGIVYSNFVTTVSPRYAGETKDGGQGFGLEPTLHTHHYKYGGVVNGIDYDAWNPEIDPHIPEHYNADNIDGKYADKSALRHRLLLADNAKPIVAFVGRLDPQKGLDLVRHALFYSINNNAQFVLLGSSPEGGINNYFWELKRHLNDCQDCHIEVGFDEDLAHLIYAGADMMIVPSLFEPCGLTQLIAMQYGTIPVVRSVGGLADTVFDKDHAHDKPLHERNGYVFRDYNNTGLESALSRAIACYYQYPEHFRDLIKNAMRCDYSWKYPGQHYLNIYEYIRDK